MPCSAPDIRPSQGVPFPFCPGVGRAWEAGLLRTSGLAPGLIAPYPPPQAQGLCHLSPRVPLVVSVHSAGVHFVAPAVHLLLQPLGSPAAGAFPISQSKKSCLLKTLLLQGSGAQEADDWPPRTEPTGFLLATSSPRPRTRATATVSGSSVPIGFPAQKMCSLRGQGSEGRSEGAGAHARTHT